MAPLRVCPSLGSPPRVVTLLLLLAVKSHPSSFQDPGGWGLGTMKFLFLELHLCCGSELGLFGFCISALASAVG